MVQFIPKKEYERKTVDYLKKHWLSGIRRPDELDVFSGAEFPSDIRHNVHFIKTFTYIYELYVSVSPYGDNEIVDPSDIREEVFQSERDGVLCVYLSVLTYMLLLHNNVCDERNMKLVQGYYWHETQTKDPFASLLGSEHLGSHAWITIGKAVLDISIRQEEMFFDFGDNPVIIGGVPGGLVLKGFSESKKTVNKWVEKYAKTRNLTVQEWIACHDKQAEAALERVKKNNR